jgi:hypothetical protein
MLAACPALPEQFAPLVEARRAELERISRLLLGELGNPS